MSLPQAQAAQPRPPPKSKRQRLVAGSGIANPAAGLTRAGARLHVGGARVRLGSSKVCEASEASGSLQSASTAVLAVGGHAFSASASGGRSQLQGPSLGSTRPDAMPPGRPRTRSMYRQLQRPGREDDVDDDVDDSEVSSSPGVPRQPRGRGLQLQAPRPARTLLHAFVDVCSNAYTVRCVLSHLHTSGNLPFECGCPLAANTDGYMLRAHGPECHNGGEGSAGSLEMTMAAAYQIISRAKIAPGDLNHEHVICAVWILGAFEHNRIDGKTFKGFMSDCFYEMRASGGQTDAESLIP
mmetsp:Transcript_4100/g.12878  ORF Transcript_4100/g.12878 Transcript_4100/m.12878 type:complete len:297 (+) Transcript_4100:317-1207(+)